MEAQVHLKSGEASLIATSLYPFACVQQDLTSFCALILMDSCMLIYCIVIDLVGNFNYIYGGSFTFYSDCIWQRESVIWIFNFFSYIFEYVYQSIVLMFFFFSFKKFDMEPSEIDTWFKVKRFSTLWIRNMGYEFLEKTIISVSKPIVFN